ncbi:hypothetical protein [Epilithonimonas hungarica]|uniref:Uncharacterized protein n=1 Tax=Epilithonimonas hungarica TaxID=454006 RepID=A0A1G7VYU8_9FLAO|nr:hypothetical protein [Epilithonimonas hungarica]SDG64946.1 hypothetical protein SAMN05421825_3763 [Epilithonimonas hungarica]
MEYFMNTFRGYYNVTSKIVEDDYKFIDENRLINPKPMVFEYKELQWVKENLYDFVQKSYELLSKETLEQVKTVSIENIKSRPYIFTAYSHTFDEDIYLLTIKDTNNKAYNVYIIKYETMEGIYKDGELINHDLVKKIRFENEKWYRNFFSNEDDYNKNKYSDNKTESTKEKISNSRYNTLLYEKEIYKTFEGKSYTYEEWKIFEEEQYKIYNEKRNKKGFWDNLFG